MRDAIMRCAMLGYDVRCQDAMLGCYVTSRIALQVINEDTMVLLGHHTFRFPEQARRDSLTRCHQQLAVQLLIVIVDDSYGIVNRLLQPRRTDVLKHGGIALVTSVGHQAISYVYCHQRVVLTTVTASCFDYNISSAYPSLQSAFLLWIAVSPDATAFHSSAGVFVSVFP